MNERYFVLNLDHISEGRTVEHPDRTQLVIRGKAFTHKNVPGSDDQPDSIRNCLIIAIERQALIDFYKADPGLSTDPLDGDPIVSGYDQLVEFEGYDGWDPDDIYAALVVCQRPNV